MVRADRSQTTSPRSGNELILLRVLVDYCMISPRDLIGSRTIWRRLVYARDPSQIRLVQCIYLYIGSALFIVRPFWGVNYTQSTLLTEPKTTHIRGNGAPGTPGAMQHATQTSIAPTQSHTQVGHSAAGLTHETRKLPSEPAPHSYLITEKKISVKS